MKKDAVFDYARMWRVLAYALIAAALVLLYLRRNDLAFFAGVLGASAWFLNVRMAAKLKHDLVKDGPRNWRPRAEVEKRQTEEDEEE
ncbi:MAG: hypothetical protein ABW208_09075 [Pyrinomonadaceae bacterium]